MGPRQRAQALFNLRRAVEALEKRDSAAGAFADKGLKFINGDADDAFPYADHVKACDAFLEKTGFPTLAVAVVYIENWKREENPCPLICFVV